MAVGPGTYLQDKKYGYLRDTTPVTQANEWCSLYANAYVINPSVTSC